MAEGDETKVHDSSLIASAEERNGSPLDDEIRSQLFSVLYDELHHAAQRVVRQNSGALSPTTLVHETFLNIWRRAPADLANKPRFMAYAVRAMRCLIIDC